MKGLTIRQREVYEFIEGFIRHKYPPTVRELAGHFAISVRGAYDHLKALKKKGFIRWDEGRSRSIELLDAVSPAPPPELITRVPLLGIVAAGVPVFADENFEGSVVIASELLGSGDHFALRVQGDSMNDAGILDGDIAVIHRQQHADNGDIVGVMIDQKATLKRFFLEANRARLEPASRNRSHRTIFTRELRILGKLRVVQRVY